DYDVDGVTSLSIMHLTLKAYGLDTKLFLPLRMEEGYGVSRDGITRVFEEFGKPDLFIAMDCGTTSLVEMEVLASQGVDVVIIDHHELSPKGRPKCEALVNPKVGNDFHHFCTAGLAFKVAHALLKTRKLDDFDLRETLDLVALGTVADLVPLIDENRIIVRRGLELIANTQRPGLRALKEVAGLDGFVQTHHLGFRIGPRLNAAGRLDTALTSLQVLLAEDHEEAMAGAQMLDSHNRDRQGVELAVFKEAEAMLQDLGSLDELPSIVLGSRDWHPGVVGIVASRISRMCHRPTILIAIDSEGMGKGSGRSIPGLSLVETIEHCRHLLRKGGGHAMAIGLSIHESDIPAFRKTFAEIVRDRLSNEQLTPFLELDGELKFRDMTTDFLDQYKLMEPFGMGNPEPVFLCRRVTPRLPGRIMKEKHLRVTLRQDGAQQDAIYFNAPLDNLPPPPWDVALRLQRNWYRGNETWQFTVEGIRAAE
ncbi:MAG: single-stranded-DNA-specific exonuclease RecJ, partial [Verrucomicrobiaceae bacterium]|nr:single-stranded-DNA-specific exonuclease RecJ [Verrucomicrobiaceae bacterium]